MDFVEYNSNTKLCVLEYKHKYYGPMYADKIFRDVESAEKMIEVLRGPMCEKFIIRNLIDNSIVKEYEL